MILIDSDIIIDLWRKRQAALDWIAQIGQQEIAVPGFVAFELLQGCRNASEQQTAERLLGGFRKAWPTVTSLQDSYQTYRQIHLSNAIGIIDVMIGHTAIQFGVPLHTFNQKHFSAIPNVVTVQPYKR